MPANLAESLQTYSEFSSFDRYSTNVANRSTDTVEDNSSDKLKALYTQLFKENRDLDFHHNSSLDSAYLNGELTTREMVTELLCSDMYVNFILATNSNFRFVSLCCERVLGRKASSEECMKWSSLLATDGLNAFATALTASDEYTNAFGEHGVPGLRSMSLFSSNQNMPALPKELSIKRYTGDGNEAQYFGGSGGSLLPWQGKLPPALARKAGAVLIVAGALEIARILLTVAFLAFSS